jgi:hypothetical protein
MGELEPPFDEFAAPDHTILGKEYDGLDVVTHVILGGEVVEFRVLRTTYDACKKLEG